MEGGTQSRLRVGAPSLTPLALPDPSQHDRWQQGPQADQNTGQVPGRGEKMVEGARVRVGILPHPIPPLPPGPST